MSSLYTIEIYTPAGELVADISHLCTTRTYQVRRNRAEDIYLSMSLEKAQELAASLGLSFSELFTPRVNEVRITRGSRPLVGGKIMYVHPRLTPDGATLEIRASGFLTLLSRVFLHETDTTLLTWTATDMGQVAWGLIEGIQAKTYGDFGFTEGTIQTSRDITQTYEPFGSSIAEILVQLSERENGIDFAFTPDKQFNVYYPGIGSDKTELLFSYPGNITSIGVPQDATTLTNVSHNIGSGNGDAQVWSRASLNESLATYGRAEAVDIYPSVSDTDTLDEKGLETVGLYGVPTTIPEVTIDGSMEPFLGSYWIGDQVRFAVDTTRYPAFSVLNGQTWRINEITCRIDESDHEDITTKVGYR